MWYLIYAEDKPDTLAQRLEARPAHLARLQELTTQGRLLVAGPTPAIDSEDPGAAGFTGSGIGLSSTMSDKGGDPNNWNTLLEMGTYTVNRVNWGGVTGPPLDSLVYVGLLTVSASNTVPGVSAVQQIFSPGTVDPTNIKIQWVRNYWSGSWTPWVKMVNDVQQIDGGAF